MTFLSIEGEITLLLSKSEMSGLTGSAYCPDSRERLTSQLGHFEPEAGQQQ
jgi:hypothetical protein